MYSNRFKKDKYGYIELDDSNKPILNVLARIDLHNSYEFPEILYSREDSDLADKIANNLLSPLLFNFRNHNLYEQFRLIVSQPKKIDNYIPADELNTHNAWIEYTVLNFHDINSCFENLPIKCETEMKWVDICNVINSLPTECQVKKSLSKIQAEYQIA